MDQEAVSQRKKQKGHSELLGSSIPPWCSEKGERSKQHTWLLQHPPGAKHPEVPDLRFQGS